MTRDELMDIHKEYADTLKEIIRLESQIARLEKKADDLEKRMDALGEDSCLHLDDALANVRKLKEERGHLNILSGTPADY